MAHLRLGVAAPLLAAALGLAWLPSPAAAQVCFRDRLSATCRLNLVTEFGALMAIENELRRTPPASIRPSGSWGSCAPSADGRRALRGTLCLSYDDTDLRHVLAGVKARATSGSRRSSR